MPLFILLAFLLAIGPAFGQQPTLAPSHQYFGGPSLGMVYTDACTVTGATPQTCNGMRGVVTTGTLTTAAVTAATYTVNNSRALATSVMSCDIGAYSGTWVTNGIPVIGSCAPGAGTITFTLVNVHAANALNGTLTLHFTIED
jgi:hypothetical protein